MKLYRSIAAGLIAGLAGCMAARAADSDSYTTIAARNVFGLMPIPPTCNCAPPPPTTPLPKIALTGLMTVFGQPQALFNTISQKNSSSAKPRQDFYVLAEGESEDAIKVIHIDMAGSMVTFDNQGTLQQIPLVNR